MTIGKGCKRVFATGVLAVAAAGCWPSAIYVPAVRMEAAVQPLDVRAGDTVRIAVTITNPRPDSVLLEFGEQCQVTFTVLDASDRVISPERENSHCLFRGDGRLVLAPGATWRAEGAWRAARDNGDPLPAGSYKVAAGLSDHDSTVRGKREYKMGSGAERVPIRVLPASP